MPHAVLQHDKENEVAQNTKAIVYIVCSADTSDIQKLLLSEFKRASTIRDCEQIRNKLLGGGSDSPPPWWYIVAKKLLNRLYQSENKASECKQIVRCILTYKVISKDSTHLCKITSHDKLKIADAMIWIHQNEDFLSKRTESTIETCLFFIRKQVCLATNLH